MNIAEFVDWLSTQSGWLRVLVACPCAALAAVGTWALIMTTAGREDS